MNDATIVRTGGACALLGVSAGLAGSVVGAVYGLSGQEIPLTGSVDFLSLVEKQTGYVIREWLFLAYVVFALGEGVGLYYLTRAGQGLALWALVAFSAGVIIGIVQDAVSVAFVAQFPTDYAAADATTRLALEPLARMVSALIELQQSVANVLLGVGTALYSAAILRTGVASRWFGVVGVLAAGAGIFFAVVTAAAPRFDELQPVAEQIFGLVVLWDLWAGIVMFGFRSA